MKDFSKLNKKQKAEFILNQLKIDYPKVDTPLIHNSAFQLLVATMLSVQTLDHTTNKVTPTLFKKYPDVKSLSHAKSKDIEKIIRIINYYKTKSKRLVLMAKMLEEFFEGKVPFSMKDLTSLPGVGRKVANVVISEWFARREGISPEGFVVDTHVIRVSKNLGLTKNSDATKIEKDLMELFPISEWTDMSLRLIFHGRYVAKSRGHKINEHPVWKKVYTDLGII
jgi:endonuclease-3